MKIKPHQTLLMIGDSITDTGRARPVGERHGLGNGYVSLVNALIHATYPDNPVRVLNTGISGNRVTDLQARWQSDVLELNPDWVSIMIGVNDVWRQFDSPLRPDQVDIEKYEAILEELISVTKPQLQGDLVLMTPFFIEPNRNDPMRAMIDEYSAVVKKLADRHNTCFADVQAAFDRYLAHQPSQTLSGDRVHPNPTGHMIIANSFLKTISGPARN